MPKLDGRIGVPTIRVNGRVYSRGEIARGTGYTLSAISRIFAGKRVPTMGTALAISAYLGITLDGLMDLLGYAAPHPDPPDPIDGSNVTGDALVEQGV